MFVATYHPHPAYIRSSTLSSHCIPRSTTNISCLPLFLCVVTQINNFHGVGWRMLSKSVYVITIDEVLILLPSGMGRTGIEKRSTRITAGISNGHGLVHHNCKTAAHLHELYRPAICGTKLGCIGGLKRNKLYSSAFQGGCYEESRRGIAQLFQTLL